MSYRCVVIDDEKPARDKLKRMLATHDDFAVVGEAGDADSAVVLIDTEKPDLCFLDVEMPEGNGFDVLRRVRQLPNVIFTTAYDQYAAQAFDVHSLDYLLKPFGKDRLAAALERARKLMDQGPGKGPGKGTGDQRVLKLLEEVAAGRPTTQAPSRISGRKGSRIVILDLADVLWFEAEETLVFARTAGGRFLVERTLSDLETELESRFFRAHRGYLINVEQIAEIVPGEAGTYEIVARDDQQSRAPLSRRQARKLRELLPW